MSRPGWAGVVLVAAVAGVLAGSGVALIGIGVVGGLLALRWGTVGLALAVVATAPYQHILVPEGRGSLASAGYLVAGVVLVAARRGPVPKHVLPLACLAGYQVLRVPFVDAGGALGDLSTAARLATAVLVGVGLARTFRTRRGIAALGAAQLLVPFAYVVADTVAGSPALAGDDRLAGGLSTPSELGVLAALVFAGTLPVAVDRGWPRAVPAMAAVLIAASGTRVAIVAGVLAAAAQLLAPWLTNRWNRRHVRLALAAVPVALAVAVAFPSAIERTRAAVDGGAAEFEAGATNTSIGIRRVLWETLADARATASTGSRLLGLGPGASERIVAARFDGGVHLAHSEYQRILTDDGLVGAGVLVVGFVGLAVHGLRATRRSGHVPATLPVAVCLATLSATDNPLHYPFALFVAVAACAAEARAGSPAPQAAGVEGTAHMGMLVSD
jgi:hypothetical protein